MSDWKPHIRPRLASLRLSPAREAEIAEELAQHLEERWRELVARGATPEEAAHTARTEFDGARLEALLGTLRQAQTPASVTPGAPTRRLMGDLQQDLRYAVRTFQKQPGFASAV